MSIEVREGQELHALMLWPGRYEACEILRIHPAGSRRVVPLFSYQPDVSLFHSGIALDE